MLNKKTFSTAVCRLLLGIGGLLAGVLLGGAGAVQAGTYDLIIDETLVNITGAERSALSVNGQIPAPTLRFKEGEQVILNVTNRLDTDTSLHWHGLIVPYTQDGVPGISFPGIKPGETFTYRFKINQSGTYWYHSHSGLQEQAGLYGPLVIESAKREPFKVDREYVVMLSDWTDEDPRTVLANLKKQSDYYNYNKRTLGDFFRDVSDKGMDAAVKDRLDWGQMRMDPTDIADVTGYTFLVNGKNPTQNWTGLFKPGERIRLRFINGSAMSFFDVRIPGLKMVVVQADGNNVKPVVVDEFRIAVAETYDVVVQPKEDSAYTIFAESMGRSGYARGTLAPRQGASGAIPEMRERPLLTMADMGPDHAGMDHGAMNPGAMKPGAMKHGAMKHGAMKPGTMDHGSMKSGAMKPGTMDHDSMKSGAMKPDAMKPDAMKPGTMKHGGMDHGSMKSGAMKSDKPATKVLAYKDLAAAKRYAEPRKPGREIELRLTGNMERYFWSINGKKFSEAEPIRLKFGERVRLKFINETMMNHPMHLHGMWMQLDNGKGRSNPLKHVVNVKPGQTIVADVDVDAKGKWAFHCHLLYHMASGMFRVVIVDDVQAGL